MQNDTSLRAFNDIEKIAMQVISQPGPRMSDFMFFFRECFA